MTRKPHVPWWNYFRTTPIRRQTPPFPFSHGRTALSYGARALGLPEGGTVLCPDFICHTVPESLERARLRVRFYPLGDDLTADWSALDRLSDGVAALVMVHYFGVPREAARYRSFCDYRGWRLIEDNAQGHGAEVDGQPAGNFGDIAIVSPYKSLPIRNGALLHVRPDTHFDPPQLPCQPVGLPVRLARTALRVVLDAPPPVVRATLFPCPPYTSQADFRDAGVEDWAMDSWSYDQLVRADLAEVRIRRQTLYSIWERWTSPHGLTPLFRSLPEASVPLVYPALTPSLAASEIWYRWGHRHGIDVHSWPTLPEPIVAENGGAMRRWERLLCFPLHQGIDPRALERTLARLSRPDTAGTPSDRR